MERLTERTEVDFQCNDNECRLSYCDRGCGHYQLMVNKLGEYEDAEEQGLLLRLPCKVGDTVYSVVKDGLQIFELKFSLDFYVRRIGDFGKTIFLNKEEAEQALKQMEGV